MVDISSNAAHRFTVREIADTCGVSSSAVRFYESRGVISATRTSGNQRRFDDSAACRIKIARLAQGVGLTLTEISSLFAELPDEPGPDQWGVIAGTLVDVAERKVEDLKQRLVLLGSDTKLCEL